MKKDFSPSNFAEMKLTLEIGTKIVVLNNHHEPDGFREITRVTETLAFAKVSRGGNTYELKFAREVSADSIFCEKGYNSWNKSFYRLAKDGDAEIVREKTLRIKVSRVDWTQVSREKLEQILNLLAL